jgi:hypothetical protein
LPGHDGHVTLDVHPERANLPFHALRRCGSVVERLPDDKPVESGLVSK